jgi:hypothetical protein
MNSRCARCPRLSMLSCSAIQLTVTVVSACSLAANLILKGAPQIAGLECCQKGSIRGAHSHISSFSDSQAIAQACSTPQKIFVFFVLLCG